MCAGSGEREGQSQSQGRRGSRRDVEKDKGKNEVGGSEGKMEKGRREVGGEGKGRAARSGPKLSWGVGGETRRMAEAQRECQRHREPECE